MEKKNVVRNVEKDADKAIQKIEGPNKRRIGWGVHTAIWGLTIIGVTMLITGHIDTTTLELIVVSIAGLGGYHTYIVKGL
jgi:hypothetical protein